MVSQKGYLPVLYYVHDPMCSWCWGFRKTWTQLKKRLNGKVKIKYLLGGLAADSDIPMPINMQNFIRHTWEKIQLEIPGTEFNYDFWTSSQPRRSTYQSCRALIACRMQRPEVELKMLLTIQQAYYLQARNPSDDDVLVKAAKDSGLDPEQFVQDITSDTCQELFEKELQQIKEMHVSNFPSLVLSYKDIDSVIDINYNDSSRIFQQIIDKIEAFQER